MHMQAHRARNQHTEYMFFFLVCVCVFSPSAVGQVTLEALRPGDRGSLRGSLVLGGAVSLVCQNSSSRHAFRSCFGGWLGLGE